MKDEYISSKLEFGEAFEGEKGGAIEQNVMSNKSKSNLTSQLKANMNHILFVQQKRKHGEMMFLTSRSVSILSRHAVT